MQRDFILSSEECLQKLEKLTKRIKSGLQIQQDANFFNKYRLNFEVTQPKNLVGGKLQQHQIEALQWMINLASQESNGILADDMGLGKTIQAISYLAYMKEQNGVLGKHLIICPKSVVNNWIRQINKWFPSSRAVLLLSTEKQREACLKEFIRPRKFDIVVTTFEGAKNCIGTFLRMPWEVLIVDEAHKIKNSNSQNFIALHRIKASFKLLLTGTPLSNNLQQLWSLLYFIMPSIFNDPQLFNQIQESVQNFEGNEQDKLNFKLKVAKYFHEIINPFFKRRAKKDLDLGLPQKFEKTLYVPMSKLQLQMYKNFLRYGSVYGEGFPLDRHYQNARKICLHPYLFDKIWPEDEEQFGQKAIQNCGKLKVLDKILKIVVAQKRKTLIFSQFTMFLDLLEEYCQFREYNYCRLDGNTSIQLRQEYMNDFNNTDKYQIFMLSTRAGGLGINLTGADTVIIYDIDWNPQNDIQAMDRAYRIGQTKNVNVYKLITEYTIQERIAEFQKYKLIWDELVIQKGAFMAKSKKDDPFANFNAQSLINIGKGDIFRLELDENEKTFDELLKLGEEKEKKMSEVIKQKMKKNVDDLNLSKINPFEEDKEPIPEPSDDEMLIIKRRDYQADKRQRSRFDRSFILPPFKFYARTQKIRQLQFEIFMETNHYKNQQCQKLLNHLRSELKNIYEQQKFHSWTEGELDAFVAAHQHYPKSSYQQIADFIKTKTKNQVQEYSKVFFQKASNNQRLQEYHKKIIQNQKILTTKNSTIQFLKQKKIKQQSKLKKIAQKKERQQRKAKQIEEKKLKAELKLQLIKEKKERKQEEIKKKNQEKQKAKQEKQARKLQEKKIKQLKNEQVLKKILLIEAHKLQQESKKILKKIQSQSSSRRNSQVSSKSTEKKVQIDLETHSQEFNRSQTNSANLPLQIVIMKPSMSKISTKIK